MDSSFKKVRAWLNRATKTEFEYAMAEGMLTEIQKKIAYLRRAGATNVAIALRLHCDISTVDREVKKIYIVLSKIVL